MAGLRTTGGLIPIPMTLPAARVRHLRFLLASLVVAAALVSSSLGPPARASTLAPATPSVSPEICEPLFHLADRRHWFWGSSLDHRTLSDAAYLTLLKRHVNVITPENALKWEVLQPTPDRYEFGPYNQILTFANQSGIQLRGHTLVWHRQLPAWLLSLSPAQRQLRLERHIATVMGQTRGRIRSWDVVNEPIAEDGRGLRPTLWLEAMGADYIARALRWARRADPDAQLVINDYGLEGDDPISERKRQTLLDLVTQLRRDQVPLDAIGIQAHLKASLNPPTFSRLPLFIQHLEAMGLKVIVTELDVNDVDLPADTTVRDQRVADVYLAFLTALRDQPSVQGVIQWGLSDRHSWLNHFEPRADGLSQRSLFFDSQLQAKPAIMRICRLLGMQEERHADPSQNP